MGHITTDILQDGWKRLDSAEHWLNKEDNAPRAIKECEGAYKEFQRACETLSEDMPSLGIEVRHDTTYGSDNVSFARLLSQADPDEEAVQEVIDALRDVAHICKSRLEQELAESKKPEYNPTANFD